MSVLNDFKAFILRGNVVDLAIGIMIGVAFGTVVNSFVTNIITPLIPSGNTGLSALVFPVAWTGGKFALGAFINAVISFLILAFVIFFFIVRPMNALEARRRRGEEPADPSSRDCPFCLSSVPYKATRCAFCTSELPAAA
jgi:large conductance mechanosensitive channel